MKTSELVIYITIGNQCSIALDTNNNLIVTGPYEGEQINLGPLTQQRAKEISKYLQRLAIHTPEK